MQYSHVSTNVTGIYLYSVHKIYECFLNWNTVCLHVSYYNLVLLKIPNKISNIHFFTEKFVGSSMNLTVPLEEGSFSLLVVEYFSHGNQSMDPADE